MRTLVIAVISIALSVAAQFALKAGVAGKGVIDFSSQPRSREALVSILTDKYVLMGFLLYGLGAVAWLAVLSRWDVSKAYPLVGLGFLLTVAVGWLLGEQVPAMRLVGVSLICAGLVFVGRS